MMHFAFEDGSLCGVDMEVVGPTEWYDFSKFKKSKGSRCLACSIILKSFDSTDPDKYNVRKAYGNNYMMMLIWEIWKDRWIYKSYQGQKDFMQSPMHSKMPLIVGEVYEDFHDIGVRVYTDTSRHADDIRTEKAYFVETETGSLHWHKIREIVALVRVRNVHRS